MNMEEIAEILKNEVIKNHPEIAIIAIYGSTAVSEQTEFSDLDMYAILDNEDKKFSIEFVFNNQTVEFWCTSWFWAEKIATADMNPIIFPVVAGIFFNNQEIYSRSEEDRTRFQELKTKAEIGKKRQIEIAMTNFRWLNSIIQQLEFARETNNIMTARWAVWNFINGTVSILAFVNNIIYSKNWGSNLHVTFTLDILPEDYERDITTLATSDNYDKMIFSGKRILKQLREILNIKRSEFSISSEEQKKNLTDGYVSIKSYLNKVLSACEKKDILAASYAATEVQLCIADEIEMMETNKLVNSLNFNNYDEINKSYKMLNFPDLSLSITENNFEKLRNDVESLDKIFVSYLKQKGVELRIFEDISEVKEYVRTS